MATAWEAYISRSGKWGDQPVAEEKYHSIGAATRTDAITAVLAIAPSQMLFSGMILGQEYADAQETESFAGLWDVKVHYSPFKHPENGDWSYSFDFSGGTSHITVAREHIDDRIDAGEHADDWKHGGLLNVDHEGVAHGLDIVTPTAKFNLKWFIAADLITADYKRKLLRTIGKVNDDDFFGAEKGELLFVNCTGNRSNRNPLMYEICYGWAFEENITDFQVGGDFNGIPILPTFDLKEGWWYFWTETEKVVSQHGGKTVGKLKAAHLERIYEYADYSVLGLGTS